MPNLLSVDIGVVNLSYCLFDIMTHKVLDWDVLPIAYTEPLLVCTVCERPAKFRSPIDRCVGWCGIHCRKSGFLKPDREYTSAHINKLKVVEIKALVAEHLPNQAAANKMTRGVAAAALKSHFAATVLLPYKKPNSKKVPLANIGKNITKIFDEKFGSKVDLHIDTVILENQLGKQAARMKSVQTMIAFWFTGKYNPIIKNVSAINKLREFAVEGEDELTYDERKARAIEKTGEMITSVDSKWSEWCDMFNQSKKKDDLSDSFLQGIWYLASIR